jgi:hypothetical protein
MSINVGMLACYDQAKESLGLYVFMDPLGGAPSTSTQLGIYMYICVCLYVYMYMYLYIHVYEYTCI